jgi:hypothetical protein
MIGRLTACEKSECLGFAEWHLLKSFCVYFQELANLSEELREEARKVRIT